MLVQTAQLTDYTAFRRIEINGVATSGLRSFEQIFGDCLKSCNYGETWDVFQLRGGGGGGEESLVGKKD
jgi:hypothetical protein